MKASEIKQTLEEMQLLANDLSEYETRLRQHNDIMIHKEANQKLTNEDYERRDLLSGTITVIKSQIKQLAKSIYEQD